MRRKICWMSLPVIVAFVVVACGKPVIRVGEGSHLGARSQTHIRSAAAAGERGLSEDQMAALDKDWAQMLTECKPAFSNLEATASTLKWTSFGIAMVGAVAGAIINPVLTVTAPMANAGWTAGFSGLSGAANTAQNTLKEQDLTPEHQLKIREEMRKQWQKAIDEYYSFDDYDHRKDALKKATAACIGYAIANPAVEVSDKPAEVKNK